MRRALLLGLLAILGEGAAAQQVSMTGALVATSACEATKKKESENPGNVRLEPSRRYDVLARNATPGTHYLVRIPDAPAPHHRWVPMECGVLIGERGTAQGDGADARPNRSAASSTPRSHDPEYLLAATWHAGFCATEAGEGKAECRYGGAKPYHGTHFSLHGLWPDDLDDTAPFPCYCGHGRPASCTETRGRPSNIDLSDDVLAELRTVMPGIRSGLHLHEWAKHGSCYEDERTGADRGADPDEYFSESVALLAALNNSPVQQLFEARLGEFVTRREIEAAFDRSFGPGAGERVLVRCARAGGEAVVTELWIGLKGEITSAPDLAPLVQAAPGRSVFSAQRSCSGGRVIRAQ